LLAVHGEEVLVAVGVETGVVICGGKSRFVNSGYERDGENALIVLKLSLSPSV
jgi:hypothetical protein